MISVNHINRLVNPEDHEGKNIFRDSNADKMSKFPIALHPNSHMMQMSSPLKKYKPIIHKQTINVRYVNGIFHGFDFSRNNFRAIG